MSDRLFSYGSNSPDRLAQRLGHPVHAEPAYAVGWRRVFRGYSRTWGGGVASLEPEQDGLVLGNVIDVSPDDLELIDQYEGYPRCYVRQPVDVHVVTGGGERAESALVYLCTSQERSAPSRDYLRAIASNLNSVWSKPDGRPFRESDLRPSEDE